MCGCGNEKQKHLFDVNALFLCSPAHGCLVKEEAVLIQQRADVRRRRHWATLQDVEMKT